LKRWIHSAPFPSNRTAARQAVNGESNDPQCAQRRLPIWGAVSWHS
jgi:hypothetical protein